jgi:multiple sugar transport system ATP-binding protein
VLQHRERFLYNVDTFAMFDVTGSDNTEGQALLAKLFVGQNFQKVFDLNKGSIPARTRRDKDGLQIVIARPDGSPMILHSELQRELPADVILGLRPEDIARAGFHSGRAVQASPCRIDLVEPAGADTYVVSQLGGKQVTARLHAETKAQPGAMLDLAFDLAKVSFFAPATGERLN